eukprot:3504119-Prymnesium_polylepis.1
MVLNSQRDSGTSAKPDAPSPRACLGLCSSGLSVYAFGGFDGETDLNDLWALELLPTNGGTATSRPMAQATPWGWARDLAEASNVEAFTWKLSRRNFHAKSALVR